MTGVSSSFVDHRSDCVVHSRMSSSTPLLQLRCRLISGKSSPTIVLRRLRVAPQGTPSRATSPSPSSRRHHAGPSSPTSIGTQVPEYAPRRQQRAAPSSPVVIITDNHLHQQHRHIIAATTNHGHRQHQQVLLLERRRAHTSGKYGSNPRNGLLQQLNRHRQLPPSSSSTTTLPPES